MSDTQVTGGEGTQRDQGTQGNGAGNSTDNNSGGAGQHTNPPVQIPDFAPLMTAIAALPEQLAKSVKEAIGTPAKPPADPPRTAESDSKGSGTSEGGDGKGSGSTASSKPTSGTSEPGKRRSFADWWVNG